MKWIAWAFAFLFVVLGDRGSPCSRRWGLTVADASLFYHWEGSIPGGYGSGFRSCFPGTGGRITASGWESRSPILIMSDTGRAGGGMLV